MRAFADGLRWLDGYRETQELLEEHGLPSLGGPLTDDEIVALAYAQGHRAAIEEIMGCFVGCATLKPDEIWSKLNGVYADAGKPVDRPTVRNRTDGDT